MGVGVSVGVGLSKDVSVKVNVNVSMDLGFGFWIWMQMEAGEWGGSRESRPEAQAGRRQRREAHSPDYPSFHLITQVPRYLGTCLPPYLPTYLPTRECVSAGATDGT